MARDPEIERRLENWARWKVSGGRGAGALGYASPALGALSGGGSSGYREAVIPTMGAEAAETDQAVQALDQPLREAVHALYLRGESAFDIAFSLGLPLRTLQARVGRAHYALLAWFQQRQQAREKERARVEAAREAARKAY